MSNRDQMLAEEKNLPESGKPQFIAFAADCGTITWLGAFDELEDARDCASDWYAANGGDEIAVWVVRAEWSDFTKL